jgi:ElaB/YqjD/DUF883 family membrane-anchored ribosome-binding protein
MSNATLTQEEAIADYKAFVDKLQDDFVALKHDLESFLKSASKTAEEIDRAKEAEALRNLDI